MVDVPCATSASVRNETTNSYNSTKDWWKNPYLLSSMALLTIATLSLAFSLLLVCRKLHRFHYCSLFLVEMAVGAITTEAIVHLIPGLIVPKKPRTSTGMPVYFPRLAVVTMSVCILHALDTASIVFFGRRQSTSHAMEWRRFQYSGKQDKATTLAANHSLATTAATDSTDQARTDHLEPETLVTVDANPNGSSSKEDEKDDEAEGTNVQFKGRSSISSSSASVQFDDNHLEKNKVITLRQAIANPKLCLEPGPHRLCSILSAGAILHSFADGVAIGAAFVKGWESGLHLSLSVGMHELAHKVADFAVLTSMGFSLQAIILLNACYWTASFLGLLLSVPLSQKSADIGIWIMTIATGVFVYISLVTMSSMVRSNYSPRHISAFIIGNIGMTTGFLVIMLASVLEFNYA